MSFDGLVGVWQLRLFEFADVDGNLFYPLGDRPTGTLVIAGEGHAVFSFSESGRSNFASDDLFNGTDKERSAAAASYVSFGGPCEVSDTSISVQVEYSLMPNWVGGTQVRLYEIDGNTLKLRTQGLRKFGGVERTARAVLVKV